MNSIARIGIVSLSLLIISWCTLLSKSDTTLPWAMMTGEIINTGDNIASTRDTSPSPQFTTSLSWALADQVNVISPAENALIDNPLMITGSAPGNWFFEWVAPVTIVNRNGLIIGEGYMSAIWDWMTTGMVDFSGSIAYTRDPATPYAYGRVILRRDNPSGMPENDAYLEMPVLFQ